MSTNETVIDLSKFPSPESAEYDGLSPEEFDKIDLYSTYTLEATSEPAGHWFLSSLICERQLGDDWCDGDIELIRYDIPKEIRWRCKNCKDHGRIIRFEGTFWDFSNLPEDERSRRSNIIHDPELEDGLDPLDVLDSMSEEETLDLLGALDQYVRGMGGDMSREFGGLTSRQVYQMLGCDWMQPGGMVYLRDDLPLEDIDKSLFLHNARTFLLLLKEEETLGTTKELGNLNRKSIAKLISALRWPEGYLDEIYKFNKVIDEDDIWLLKVLRVLLELAGLVYKRKGKFHLTRKNIELMEEEQAGKLYRLLFSTLFRKMNLAFITGNNKSYPSLQDSVPYILYRLNDEARNWTHINKLADKILLATAYTELEMSAFYSTIGDQLFSYLLQPLSHFGLIKERYSKGTPDFFHSPPDEYQITPLFNRFFTFNVRPQKPASNVIPISNKTDQHGNVEISRDKPAPTKRMHATPKMKKGDRKIYQLKISLDDIEPEIWRQVLVASDTLLPDLHKIIQTCMGWENGHLHQFEKNRIRYAAPGNEWEDTHHIDYRYVRVGDLLTRKGSKMTYEYDFGDGWTHEIALEDILPVSPDVKYPLCAGGARNCPPEDCGGPWGYSSMLEALSDPKHEEHEIYNEWLEGDFNPDYFDKDDVNALLKEKNYGCLEW